MSFERKIYGYTHTNHPSNQIVPSKWTSVSKTVSTSNSNTPNQSIYPLYFADSRYSLKDVIVGKIYFLLVRLKIKHMELSIIRRETTGVAPNQYNESETITKFEIMDGAPVRGETIPIRLFLGGFDLTPTFKDVNKKFSTRYYLSLVLVDNDGRRYFKQSEITLV
jgi:vacuolar protein sorting-associated protein 26